MCTIITHSSPLEPAFESTAIACRHRPDLGIFQGGPSRPLLASYRHLSRFYLFLTARGAPHSTHVHSSICDDAPERALHISRKKNSDNKIYSLSVLVTVYNNTFCCVKETFLLNAQSLYLIEKNPENNHFYINHFKQFVYQFRLADQGRMMITQSRREMNILKLSINVLADTANMKTKCSVVDEAL